MADRKSQSGKHRMRFSVPCALGFSLLLLALIPSAQGDTSANSPQAAPIAVIEPELSQPYRRVFDSIVEGIEQRTTRAMVRRSIGGKTQPPTLTSWLNERDINVAIALGRQPWGLLSQSAWQGNWVVGALYLAPNTPQLAGVSLYLDPTVVAHNFRQINPSIKRVIMVANASTAAWYEQRIATLEPRGDLEFTVLETDTRDSVQTARRYWNAAEHMNPKTEALWLDHDLSDTLVDGLIDLAWERELTLFAANLMHVEHGALFALIPDTEKLGERLAELAEAIARNPDAPRTLESLSATRLVINLRVAAHLNLPLKKRDAAIAFE